MDPRNFDTPNGLNLEIRLPAGDVQLRATDTTQTRLQISGDRNPEDVTVRFSPGSNGVSHLLIEQKRKGAFDWFSRPDHLTIDLEIPRETMFEARCASTTVGITGEIKAVEFHSVSGDLTFDTVTGFVDVRSANGDVTGGSVGGDLTVHTASGDLKMGSVGGATDLKLVSGDVTIGRSSGSMRARTVSGEVELNNSVSGEVDVRTVSGNVAIGITPGRRLWLDLSSASGSTSSELGSGGEGGGSADRIVVTTVSGDIRVHRVSEIPSQPVAS